MTAPFDLTSRTDAVPSDLAVFLEDPADPTGRGYRNPWGVNLEP